MHLRVASRWLARSASRIDPPPRLYEAVVAWLRSVQATEALRASVKWRAKVKALREMPDRPDFIDDASLDDRLVDIGMIERAAKRMGGEIPTGPKPDTYKATFPIDLRGWRHREYVERALDEADARAEGRPFRGRESIGWFLIREVTVTLHTKYNGQNRGFIRGGSIQLWYPPPSVTDLASFRRDIERMERTAAHELRHLSQKVLEVAAEVRTDAAVPSAGMPPGGSRDFRPDEHALRDEEFYTRLADDIAEFRGLMRHIGPATDGAALRLAIRVFTDQAPMQDVGRRVVSPSDFFSRLHAADPRKWRKAVSEFVAAVT